VPLFRIPPLHHAPFPCLQPETPMTCRFSMEPEMDSKVVAPCNCRGTQKVSAQPSEPACRHLGGCLMRCAVIIIVVVNVVRCTIILPAEAAIRV
jgi:hypothetical protein